MSVAEIEETKTNLITWINQLSDANLLTILDSIRASNSGGDWWDDLTDAQKDEINEGIADADAGRVISSEEFWHRLKNA
jgi:hypothetical protein